MPKLLLADDSVTIQRVIELTFADEDIEVVAVGDGEEAIAKLASEPPDLVLADVGMPKLDGYEVAEHVHRTAGLSHIPVLLLTGAFDPVDEARSRAAGVAGVLVKPFEPQMVIARVRELLDKGRPQSDVEQRSHDLPAGSSERPSATDALLAAPGSDGSSRTGTVDDYFERLDAAFAHLTGDPAPAREAEAAGSTAPAGEVVPVMAVTDAPVPMTTETQSAISMADAFTALLAVEQGEPPPPLSLAGLMPSLSDDLVEAVARRVTAEIAERVVRQIAPDTVSHIAERIVREEIDRLKGLAPPRS